MQAVPRLAREQALEIGFGAGHARAAAQPPALGQAMNVGVHRKGGHPEGLGHHHRRRLVPHPRQRLQRLETLRHRPAVALDQQFRQAAHILRLGARQPQLADVAQDRRLAQGSHRRRVGAVREQGGRHLVHLLVGALRAEQHRHQQGEGVAVVEGHRRLGVELIEAAQDQGRPLRLAQGVSNAGSRP